MNIVIDKNGPFSIKEQIKRQISLMVSTGQIESGQSLPSARDLATLLKVNRNTISWAYKELAAEGMLKIKVGSGTYVKEGKMNVDVENMERIFNEAVASGRDKGISPGVLADYFMTRAMALSDDIKDSKILVVDCNYDVIEQISETIKKALGVKTEGRLIQEIESDPETSEKLIAEKDLVVCGFNHFEELRRALPSIEKDVVAVVLNPDIQIIKEVMKIPAGSTVGYCCANQRSTETAFRKEIFSGGREVKRIFVGAERVDELKEMLKKCSTVFATSYVYDKIKKMIPRKTRLVCVTFLIDPKNIELINETLIELKTRN